MAAALFVALLVALMAGAESPAVHTVVVVEVHASSKSGTECNEAQQTKQIALLPAQCEYGSLDPDLLLRSSSRR